MCFLQRIRKRRESLVTKTLRKGGNALDGRRRRRRRRFRLGRSSRQRGLVGAWVFSSTPKVETMGQGLDEEGGGESEGETEGRGRREWQRESERVREGWVRRLTAIDFSRQTRGLFVPLSILYYPSTSLSFSLSLPRLTTFLHLSPSSYSRSSFFLPSSTLSFLLSFARHASSSYPLANSRDIFPQFYIYIYIQSCVCTHSHTEIFSVSSTRVNVLFCIHFCHPSATDTLTLAPCPAPSSYLSRDRGGRSRVAASFPFNRRWPTRSREASIISGFFILFLEFDSARISKYSVPE